MGGKLSLFYYRRRLHSTMPVGSSSKSRVYDEDVTRHVDCDAPFYAALRNGAEISVFLGTDAAGTFSAVVRPPLVAAEQRLSVALREGAGKLFALRTAPR